MSILEIVRLSVEHTGIVCEYMGIVRLSVEHTGIVCEYIGDSKAVCRTYWDCM